MGLHLPRYKKQKAKFAVSWVSVSTIGVPYSTWTLKVSMASGSLSPPQGQPPPLPGLSSASSSTSTGHTVSGSLRPWSLVHSFEDE